MASGLKLSDSHQWWIYGTFALLFCSGAVWTLFHFFLVSSSPFGETRSPVEIWSLTIHGGAAMAFLLILGSLIPGHMKSGYRAKLNHVSGLMMVGMNLCLIFTGFALYYAGEDELRRLSSWFHLGLGFLILPLLVWHVLKRP